MAKRRHLKNAPIHEALIDIHFNASRPVDIETAAAALVGGAAATQMDIWEALMQFKLEPTGETESSAKGAAIGKRIEFNDTRQVLMIRPNGYTFSQLVRYQDWDALSAPAFRLWEQYRQLASATEVHRTAVRYINKLELPVPANFDDYLTCAPRIPAALPQGLVTFTSRNVIPFDHDTAIVTQSLEGEAHEGKAVRVLLDIDVFCRTTMDAGDTESLRMVLARLRDCKNDIFFEHITEKTAEMYE